MLAGDDAYRVVLRLATGGMAHVDVVVREHGSFARLYARKSLLPAYHDDADVRRMFLEEARIAGALTHPNVVRVLDVGAAAGVGPYLIMDYVEGVSLAELLRELGDRGERIPLPLALGLMRDLARALDAAHSAVAPDGSRLQVVHRDVSPQNILLGYDGVARLTDFGVAKIMGHLVRTQEGVLKGKLGYMAPEQLRGESIDSRADLFGFGVVLYEVLAGKRLYSSRAGVHPAHRILHEPPPDIGDDRSDLPPALVALLFGLLAKRAEHRPIDAAAVADSLAELAREEPAADLGTYVGELFAPARRNRAEQIAMGLRRSHAAADFDDATRVDPPREEELGTAVDLPRAEPAGYDRRRSEPGVLVGLVALTVASVLFTLWTFRSVLW